MARRPIVIAPDPVLKKRALSVEGVTEETRRLMDDMLETMYAANGIGLAAPQVGVLERIVVMDTVDRGQEPAPLFLANPEIVAKSADKVKGEEGCLSLPDFYGEVTRHAQVTVRYLDRAGETRTLNAEGRQAICIQHEIDHLNGVLFVDHLSALKRNMILRKLTKLKRGGHYDEHGRPQDEAAHERPL